VGYDREYKSPDTVGYDWEFKQENWTQIHYVPEAQRTSQNGTEKDPLQFNYYNEPHWMENV
jgi:hypothetical protein